MAMRTNGYHGKLTNTNEKDQKKTIEMDYCKKKMSIIGKLKLEMTKKPITG